MTTGNKIITKTIPDVVYIPLECVQTGADSIPYIYLKNGDKQIVVLGESNENNIIIEQGIQGQVQLYLSLPENAEKFKLQGEDLISVIKEKERIKKEQEERQRLEAEKVWKQREAMREQFTGFSGDGQPKDPSAEQQTKRKKRQEGISNGDTVKRGNLKRMPEQGAR
jgi:hypothetical protein